MTVNWLEIGESLQAVLGAVGSTLPLVIALVVAYVAWRQWQTAKDKLALELFDRRFAAYNEFMDAIADREEEISTTKSYRVTMFNPDGGPKFEAHERLTKRTNDIRFLFGASVWEIVIQMYATLAEQARAHEAMFTQEGMSGYDEYDKWRSKMGDQRVEFRRAIEPYMMMGHIAVNRPTRARRARA